MTDQSLASYTDGAKYEVWTDGPRKRYVTLDGIVEAYLDDESNPFWKGREHIRRVLTHMCDPLWGA
jgi:hypothetical protein